MARTSWIWLKIALHEPWQFDARCKDELAICMRVTNALSFTSEISLMNEGGGGGLSSQISAILSYRMTTHFYFPTKLRCVSCFSSFSCRSKKYDMIWQTLVSGDGLSGKCKLSLIQVLLPAFGIVCNLFDFPVIPNCVTFNYFPRESGLSAAWWHLKRELSWHRNSRGDSALLGVNSVTNYTEFDDFMRLLVRLKSVSWFGD